MLNELNNSLQAMGLVQYLLVLLFLMSYPLALTQFAGDPGRSYAALLSSGSAVGFVVVTHPWEHGVLLMALAVLAMGAFAAAVWLLHALMLRLQPGMQSTVVARVAPARGAASAALPQQAAVAAQRKASRPGVLPIA